MSTSEIVAEKIKELPEVHAQAVLAFILELSASPAISPSALMRLPLSERSRILAHQAAQAEALYRQSPDIVVEDADAPLNYDWMRSRRLSRCV